MSTKLSPYQCPKCESWHVVRILALDCCTPERAERLRKAQR